MGDCTPLSSALSIELLPLASEDRFLTSLLPVRRWACPGVPHPCLLVALTIQFLNIPCVTLSSIIPFDCSFFYPEDKKYRWEWWQEVHPWDGATGYLRHHHLFLCVLEDLWLSLSFTCKWKMWPHAIKKAIFYQSTAVRQATELNMTIQSGPKGTSKYYSVHLLPFTMLSMYKTTSKGFSTRHRCATIIYGIQWKKFIK